MSNEKKFVCIIDDDTDITALFHEAIRQNIFGISVIVFNDPIEAIEHFAANKNDYALVISDLRMPGLNGLELLKTVKRSNRAIRTILMSAFNFEEDELFQKYMKEGIIDNTIEKPVTINRLCQKVRDELSLRIKNK